MFRLPVSALHVQYPRKPEEGSGSLRMKLQLGTIVRCHVCAGNRSRILARIANAFKAGPSLQPPGLMCFQTSFVSPLALGHSRYILDLILEALHLRLNHDNSLPKSFW